MKHIINISILLFAVFILTAGNKDKHSQRKNFNIIGAWELVRIEHPDGKIDTMDAGSYTRCKIYDADSIYYSIRLFSDGDHVMILPNEMANYTLNDSVYIENGRITPFQVRDDTTITMVWDGYVEVMRKATTMTEARKEEIRNIVRSNLRLNEETDRITNFVLSTSERKLLSANQRLIYIIVILALVFMALGLYFFQTLKRKREMERQLRELQEIRNLRPQPVANAMKEAEANFFKSEYHLELRKKIESGSNFNQKDWEKLEQELKAVYPDFSTALYQMYNLSQIEYRVCLLIKVRISPTEIARVLKKEPSTISSMRGRLYHKVFGNNGGAKEWDEFILSL